MKSPVFDEYKCMINAQSDIFRLLLLSSLGSKTSRLFINEKQKLIQQLIADQNSKQFIFFLRIN